MIDFGQRDPEEIGPEHPDDTAARMRALEARHYFVEGENGKCGEEMWLERNQTTVQVCNREKWSVLHIDEMLDMHDHGGRDCMCFEDM